MAVHNELDCITKACCMWRSVLDDADMLAVEVRGEVDPEQELRVRVPAVLATFSPAARDMIRDHLAHCEELVAAFHLMTNALAERATS